MIRKLLQILLILGFTSSFAQRNDMYFSEALKKYLPEYIKKSNMAYSENNFIDGQQLFDSLVKKKLEGCIFDNYTVKTFSSKKINLDKINKPILLLTYASWCVINSGDIPALNQLAIEHEKDLKIIIFFWGTEKQSRHIAKSFSKKIEISYTDFENKSNYNLIAQLKNTLGFPTSYFLDSNKRVINICRVNSYPYQIHADEAFEKSYSKFSSLVSYGFRNSLELKSNLEITVAK